MNCVMNPQGEPDGSGNTPNLYRPFATPGGRFDKRIWRNRIHREKLKGFNHSVNGMVVIESEVQ